MKQLSIWHRALALTLSSSLTVSVTAAQLRGGVACDRLDVRVEVVDDVATTRLLQTFTNPGHRDAEGTWILPLSEGAVADDFRITVGGVEMTGEVLDATSARNVYEEIVRSRRDPGLLEFVGRGCLRARVFPIPAGGSVDVEVTLHEILPRRLGLTAYGFPLESVGIQGVRVEAVTFDLSLRTTAALGSAFTGTPRLEVLRTGDHAVRASYEGRVEAVEGGELSLYWSHSDQDLGLTAFSHWPRGAKEGSLLLLLEPKLERQTEALARKHVTFVLDTSGSMSGAKIEQARGALRRFLGSLGPEDRFDVIPFASAPRPFFDAPRRADEASVARALELVKGLEPAGGTNVADAVSLALSRKQVDPEEVPLLVFLTDGLPTIGMVEPETILQRVATANTLDTRIFTFGVGDDVDTHLLDRLAGGTGGSSGYVRPDEDIEVETSVLFQKLSHPVLTELALEVEGAYLTRQVPAHLPDLFRGDRLELVARYDRPGPLRVKLSGSIGGVRQERVYELDVTERGDERFAFVPSLWAQRRVGFLLDTMRLNGESEELLDEVVRLGTQHRIVTPYTSHLILEEGLRVAGDTVPPGGAGTGGGRPGAPGRGRGGPTTPGGAAGPRASGTPPSSPITSGGTTTGSDGFFLGRGSSRRAPGSPAPDLERVLVTRLRALGVFSEDTPEDEALEVARELALAWSRSADGMRALGTRRSGKAAVDESEAIAHLMRGGADRDQRLLDVFSRRVHDKVFLLRDGIWKDRAVVLADAGTDDDAPAPRRVEAWSAAYFALVDEHPGLQRYLSLGTRLLIEWEGERIEIVEPAAETAPEQDAERDV